MSSTGPSGDPGDASSRKLEALNAFAAVAACVATVVIAVKDGGAGLLLLLALALLGAAAATTGWLRNSRWLLVAGVLVTGLDLIAVAILVQLDDEPRVDSVRLSASCNDQQLPVKPGDIIDLTYDVTVIDGSVEVDLGLAFYDEEGTDMSTGTGDDYEIRIGAGTASFDRQFRVPDAPNGDYELVAEVWPAGSLPDIPPDVETLKDDKCDQLVVLQR